MPAWLIWLDRKLPRRLTSRITLAMVVIVIAAGLITTVAVNVVLSRSLTNELVRYGEALTLALGESLANALVEGNLVTVRETLDGAINNNPDIVYAFAFGPGTPVVHTFPGGFPADLTYLLSAHNSLADSGVLLRTEQGLVHHFVYQPFDGLPAEIHVGVSQARIAVEQARITTIVILLTAVGCLAAAVITYVFSHLATRPLAELTYRVQRLGQGSLEERIDLPPGDEIGDLALAFNQMAAEIAQAIQQLQTSESGYRDLLTAASAVGEGIALICDDGPQEGEFLFVNDTFARLAGFQPDELIGANAATILHPDSLENARHIWQTIRARTMPTISDELVLVNRHGEEYVLETAGTLVDYQGKRALAWFTRDVTERKVREAENARLWQELQQKEQLRGELLARAIRAQEDERQRIARELHDATGQSLNALVFGLNAVNAALAKEPESAPELIERLKISASDTVKELQTIIYDLRPSLLDDLGLIPALRWYAQERLEPQGVQVNLSVSGDAQRLPAELETALFRIGQEAITNISRHADAHQVHLAVQFAPEQIQIMVCDDGIGFVLPDALNRHGQRQGLGLLGMQERAALLGGQMRVESKPGGGACLTAVLPLRNIS